MKHEKLIASWRAEAKKLEDDSDWMDGCNGRPHNPERAYHMRIEADRLKKCAVELEALAGAAVRPPSEAEEIEWMEAEFAAAPKNGERFALGQRDNNGAIQNAYTTGARDVIDRWWRRKHEAVREGRDPQEGWQAIDPGPAVGEDVLAFFPDAAEEYQVMVVHRLGKDWYQQDVDNCPDPLSDEGIAPTHWMPLPSPPTDLASPPAQAPKP